MNVQNNATKNKNLFCLEPLPVFKRMIIVLFSILLRFSSPLHTQFCCESELGHLGPRLAYQHEGGVSECLISSLIGCLTSELKAQAANVSTAPCPKHAGLSVGVAL